MNEDSKAKHEAAMMEYLKARVSRAQLLKAAAVGAAAAALPGAASAAGTGAAPAVSFPFYPQVPGTYTPEKVGDILNVADTLEHLAITFLTAAVRNASTLSLSGLVLAQVQAILAEEVYHAQFLEANGATSQTDTFNIPDPKMITDFNTFFATLEITDTIANAAYMTATREFAELGQPTLAKYAYQIGSVEAEHRVAARGILALRGDLTRVPSANKAFETDLFLYVRDAAAALKDLGFLGGSGTTATYPGTAAALAAAGPMVAAVIQKTPNNASSSVTAKNNLLAARGERLSTTMSGLVEVPAGDPNGRGTAVLILNPAEGTISYQLTVTGIALPAIAAHIHKGAPGVAGPVVVPLGTPTNGSSSGTVTADPALIQDIVANPGNYYVNVHNGPFPGGAVRGQLG